MNHTKRAVFFAFLAAMLYALNAPFSKLLLHDIPATIMAAFLYLGAGAGLFLVGVVQKLTGKKKKNSPLPAENCRTRWAWWYWTSPRPSS